MQGFTLPILNLFPRLFPRLEGDTQNLRIPETDQITHAGKENPAVMIAHKQQSAGEVVHVKDLRQMQLRTSGN